MLRDREVYEALKKEHERQTRTLNLIPSENSVSPGVLEASGSILTNKYSEGYPRKRYYGGNFNIDTIEELAIERAKKLFGAEHVNVQPYSGSPANMAIFFALLELGDKFMGMDLAQGGHLTHGSKVNFSGRFYRQIPYGVDKETELIDYDEVRKIALAENPKMIISGATAYPRIIDFKRFDEIADEVGAYSMADISHVAGLVAAGVHPSPLPFTDVVTTTTHKTLRGPRGAMIMCKNEFAEKIDKAVFPGLQGGPHENVIAAKAVAFGEALEPGFAQYQRQIVKNSKAMADELMSLGIRLVSNGTDNHLILIDLRSKNITGKAAERLLDEAGITVNKNMIPYDPRSPWDPSGIRLGTPTITSRGMKEAEAREIARLIARTIDNTPTDKIRQDVSELCSQFPLFASV